MLKNNKIPDVLYVHQKTEKFSWMDAVVMIEAEPKGYLKRYKYRLETSIQAEIDKLRKDRKILAEYIMAGNDKDYRVNVIAKRILEE